MSKKNEIQLIEPVLIGNLITLAKSYAKIARIKVTTVGTNSTKTASFYEDLESGLTSCTLRKYDLVTRWFVDNWPEGYPMTDLKDPRHLRTRRTTKQSRYRRRG